MKASLSRNLLILSILMIACRADAADGDNEPMDDSDVNDAPDIFVSVEAVPVAALDTLRVEANGFQFEEVEIDVDNGVTQYALEWERDGRTFDTTVGAEGDLVERDEPIAIEEMPQAVRDTVRNFFPRGAALNAEHSIKVSYEIQSIVLGETQALEIDPTGRILQAKGIEEETNENQEDGFPYDTNYLVSRSVTISDLPKPVYDGVLRETLNSEKFQATQRESYIGSSTYEVAWQADGRNFEAAISAAGDLLDKRQTLRYDELPSPVRAVVDTHFTESGDPKIAVRLSSSYDIDADFTTPDYQIIVDPSGCVRDASGPPDPSASAPLVAFEGSTMIVEHQVLLGMPKPRLEVSTDLKTWTETPMVPTTEFQLEARIPQGAQTYVRIILGNGFVGDCPSN